MIFDRKQCKSIAESSGARCTKKALRGSRYCWQHQATVSAIFLFVAGFVGNEIWDYAKGRIAENYKDRPKVTLWLGDTQLTNDNVFFAPFGATLQLKFWLKNDGTAMSQNSQVFFRVATNVCEKIQPSPGWLVPFASMNGMKDVQSTDVDIPPQIYTPINPLLVPATNFLHFVSFVKIVDAENLSDWQRVHFIFTNRSPAKDVLLGPEATDAVNSLYGKTLPLDAGGVRSVNESELEKLILRRLKALELVATNSSSVPERL